MKLLMSIMIIISIGIFHSATASETVNSEKLIRMYSKCIECLNIAETIKEKWGAECDQEVSKLQILEMPAYRKALRSYYFEDTSTEDTANLVKCSGYSN
jgi:hypothetical protein